MNSFQLATIFGVVCCVTDCYANPERSFDLCELLAIIWNNLSQIILLHRVKDRTTGNCQNPDCGLLTLKLLTLEPFDRSLFWFV